MFVSRGVTPPLIRTLLHPLPATYFIAVTLYVAGALVMRRALRSVKAPETEALDVSPRYNCLGVVTATVPASRYKKTTIPP